MVWAGAASMGGLLAGCGDDDDNGDAGGGSATATPTTGSGAPTATSGGSTAPTATSGSSSGTPSGGMLRVALSESDLPTMDPHMHNLRTGIIFFYHTHDNLGARDQETLLIEPWLADSWEILEPTIWQMKLKQDVLFHNGDPFTAETVKWNWERIINPEQASQQLGNHAQIQGVEVIDDYTVNVITIAPYPIFTERLQNFQMIPEKLAQEMGDEWLAENPVGTGPYKFVEWKKAQEINLTVNENYWNPDVQASYSDLNLRIIPGVPTQLAELLSGNIDIIRVIPFDQMQTVTDSGIAVPAVQPILRVAMIKLDAMGRGTPDNPYTDVRVRNAANHAVDTATYIDALQPGGDRTPAMVNPKHFGFDASIEPHEYDPELAKSLMVEAGYEDGFDVSWLRGPSLMPNADQVDQATQRDLAAVGINAEFNTIADGNVITTLVNEGNADPMFSYSWGSYSVFDTDGIYYDMLQSESIFSYYSNPEFDALIEEARSSLDEEVRIDLYSQAQQIVRAESPAIFQWGLHAVWGVNNNVDWVPAPDEIDRYYWAKPKS
jgi:peptide/nickel transport system substrate-binding protein